MTLNQAYALATDATFQQEVRMAALQYAQSVMVEPVNPLQQVDEKRRALASSVLVDGGVATLQKFVYCIAAAPGFSAVPNDAQDANDAAINSAMITLWNDIAGVVAEDLAS